MRRYEDILDRYFDRYGCVLFGEIQIIRTYYIYSREVGYSESGDRKHLSNNANIRREIIPVNKSDEFYGR